MMIMKGIDVSKHQGNINWDAVTTDFAIIRAGYGIVISQKDPMFETNYKACKERGIPVGAYWYSYASTEVAAKLEAEVCLEVLKGKQFEMPIYYDIEEKGSLRAANKIAKVFCETLEKAGYFVGIYASASPLKTYFSEEIRKRYAIWVAHYGVAKPNYSGNYGMWQYSSAGKVNGIYGNVDMDFCYEDYPSIIKNACLNGFKKTHTVAVGDTLSAIAKRYGITVDELAEKNKLIHEGQKLIV